MAGGKSVYYFNSNSLGFLVFLPSHLRWVWFSSWMTSLSKWYLDMYDFVKVSIENQENGNSATLCKLLSSSVLHNPPKDKDFSNV